MDLDKKKKALVRLGEILAGNPEELQNAIRLSRQHNPWFTEDNCQMAIDQIVTYFLNEQEIENWVNRYDFDGNSMKRIGLILAGNIPMVGFHDVLCCFISGNIAQIKLSDKDAYLLPYCIELLGEIDKETTNFFEYVERLESPDAVIATGSNNSALYFERYFGKFPNVIRKNRNAISILDGTETTAEIKALGVDVFSYFGLGCRNVSKIYIPESYQIDRIMEVLHDYNEIILHSKYLNNYNFNYAIYLLNRENFFMNGALILREHTDIVSRISCLHFERYQDLDVLENELIDKTDQIQCISSKVKLKNLETVPLGSTQKPKLCEYADGVDTVEFLLQL
jgi:hypothetical protein